MHIPQELSPSMATHSNEPQFPCRSPGPACQSCRVLRLLQSLQVDSLMLQEWFILQLSWPGNPHQGRGDMQHGCTAPASCNCPLSPKKTIYPPRDKHFAPKRSQSRILNTQACNSKNSALVGEHPGPLLFPPLVS